VEGTPISFTIGERNAGGTDAVVPKTNHETGGGPSTETVKGKKGENFSGEMGGGQTD